MRIDPHNSKKGTKQWLTDGQPITGISSKHAALLKAYLKDMQLGRNTDRPGSLGYARLCTLKGNIQTLFRLLNTHVNVLDITKHDKKSLLQLEESILILFSDMTNGKILTSSNAPYNAESYKKDLKAFWKWYMRVQERNGIILPDVTKNVKRHNKKGSTFAYLTEEQIRALLENCMEEWPDDFSMRSYCEDRQVEGWREIQ